MAMRRILIIIISSCGICINCISRYLSMLHESILTLRIGGHYKDPIDEVASHPTLLQSTQELRLSGIPPCCMLVDGLHVDDGLVFLVGCHVIRHMLTPNGRASLRTVYPDSPYLPN